MKEFKEYINLGLNQILNGVNATLFLELDKMRVELDMNLEMELDAL